MSMDFDNNFYSSPEKFGLEILGSVNASRGYDFDLFVVWRDRNYKLWWASDSGCSCPMPFENITRDQLKTGSYPDLCFAASTWAEGRESQTGIAVLEMLRRLREKLATRPWTLRDYLQANMFDGDDGGTTTMQVSTLLDEIVELVDEFNQRKDDEA